MVWNIDEQSVLQGKPLFVQIDVCEYSKTRLGTIPAYKLAADRHRRTIEYVMDNKQDCQP